MSTIDRPIGDGQRTADPAYGYSRADDYYAAQKGDGWLAFTSFMLGLAGVFGLIAGIAAIAGSSFYVNGSRYVFSDLKTWGWIVTLVAVTALFAAAGVLAGAEWARWFGIIIAGLQAIAQLLFIQAYPWWSLCVFAIDLMIIYGLSVYGGSRKRATA